MHVQLDWNFIQESYDDDKFYQEFDDAQLPKDTEAGDSEDFLRKADVCPDYDGTLNLSNCPKPPDCSSSVNEKYGKAKLCINRVPSPYQSIWYVAAMKCIPSWENCKKCICGTMKGSNSKGYCIFDADKTPDDDHILLDCKNSKDVQMMEKVYTFGGSEVIDISSTKDADVSISYDFDKNSSYLGGFNQSSSSSDSSDDGEYENIFEDDEY